LEGEENDRWNREVAEEEARRQAERMHEELEQEERTEEEEGGIDEILQSDETVEDRQEMGNHGDVSYDPPQVGDDWTTLVGSAW
jgi:hypothetical protein